ncbi:MAG: glycoside hydrolase family 20 zincin-like fold domain-containing protein, partial [Bacteroidaceae bacterium]|nr:glycoside hydrolase family 20 zincin-like fold domain-containing protein [Bacteroidaceae bacterium]
MKPRFLGPISGPKTIIALSLLLMLLPMAALAEINVIPLPTRTVEKEGSFILRPSATIAYTHKSLQPAAEYLREKLRPATGYDLPLRKGKKADIVLSLNPRCEAGAEGYTLTATPDGVVIEAAAYRGIVHGIATLRQLLP